MATSAVIKGGSRPLILRLLEAFLRLFGASFAKETKRLTEEAKGAKGAKSAKSSAEQTETLASAHAAGAPTLAKDSGGGRPSSAPAAAEQQPQRPAAAAQIWQWDREKLSRCTDAELIHELKLLLFNLGLDAAEVADYTDRCTATLEWARSVDDDAVSAEYGRGFLIELLCSWDHPLSIKSQYLSLKADAPRTPNPTTPVRSAEPAAGTTPMRTHQRTDPSARLPASSSSSTALVASAGPSGAHSGGGGGEALFGSDLTLVGQMALGVLDGDGSSTFMKLASDVAADGLPIGETMAEVNAKKMQGARARARERGREREMRGVVCCCAAMMPCRVAARLMQCFSSLYACAYACVCVCVPVLPPPPPPPGRSSETGAHDRAQGGQGAAAATAGAGAPQANRWRRRRRRLRIQSGKR